MFNRSRTLILEAAASMRGLALALMNAQAAQAARRVSGKKLKNGNIRMPAMPRYTSYGAPHEGKAEVARRRRQIEAGTLTRSNGLEVRS